jgi:hypothetical protein
MKQGGELGETFSPAQEKNGDPVRIAVLFVSCYDECMEKGRPSLRERQSVNTVREMQE